MLRYEVVFVAGCQVLAPVVDLPRVHAMAGKINKPSIAVPMDEKGKPNPMVESLRKVFVDHEKDFANGRFINAHTVMNFRGDAKRLNRMIDELSKVEGAVVTIRFSNEDTAARMGTAGGDDGDSQPCQWSIDHNGWADPNRLSLTVFLGDNTIRREDVIIPKRQGVGNHKQKPEEIPRIWLETLPLED